jgi:uncharacterized membrane protein YqjE
MDEPPQSQPGIFASLKNLLQCSLAIFANRLELLLLELKEERLQIFNLLLLAGLSLVLATITLAVITATVVALCLRAGRLDLLLGLILLYILLTAIAFWRLRQGLKKWEPFPETLAELKKDKACLETKS